MGKVVSMTTEATVHTSVDLAASQHRALKVKLAAKGKSIRQWIQEQVAAELARAK